VDLQLTVLTKKKSFYLLENFFLRDVVPSSSLHSTGYAKMFMESFNFLLLNGYAFGSEGGIFTQPLPAVATEIRLKLQQIIHNHLA